MTKLDKNQLLETIRDTIYEVLEEEIDRKIQEVKKEKTEKLNKSKAKAVKRRKVVAALKEKKAKIKKAYGSLSILEKKLSNISEKWAKDVEIEKTGEHAGKTVEQIRKRLAALKKKEDKTE